MRLRRVRKASGDESRDGQSGNCALDRMRSFILACDGHSFLRISVRPELMFTLLRACFACRSEGGIYCVSSALLG